MTKDWRSRLDDFLGKYQARLGLLIAFLIPIKLSWTLAIGLPVFLVYLLTRARHIGGLVSDPAMRHMKIFAIFIIWLCLSSFFGIDVLNSWKGIQSLAFFSLCAFFYYDLIQTIGPVLPLLALLVGQSVAAIHSIVHAAYPWFMPRFFIGMVTESGQLSISIIIALGLICLFNQQMSTTSRKPSSGLLIFGDILTPTRRKFAFLCLLVSGILLSFSPYFLGTPEPQLVLLVIFLAALGWNAYHVWQLSKNLEEPIYYKAVLVSNLVLPLCSCALLANLKRGPWAGVAAGSCLLLLLFSRKLLAPVILMSLVVFGSIEPIRARMEQSAEHFYIHGGRKVIWDIGGELALRYPLGIGFENSPVLRDFSTEIPDQLRHFHNNLLNILVETGWIGAAIFLWWLCSILVLAWRAGVQAEDRILARAIACAIISLQIAGLVEYNFGDSEIMFMLYLLLAVLGHLLFKSKAITATKSSHDLQQKVSAVAVN